MLNQNDMQVVAALLQVAIMAKQVGNEHAVAKLNEQVNELLSSTVRAFEPKIISITDAKFEP